MASFINDLRACGFIVGYMRYADSYPGQPHSAKIVLSVRLQSSLTLPAIMDTGAPWCIFNPEILSILTIDKESGYRPDEGLNIRGEIHHGVIENIFYFGSSEH